MQPGFGHPVKRSGDGLHHPPELNPTSTATVKTMIAATAIARAIKRHAGSRSLPLSSLSLISWA
jgi:hypothetical protein